MATYLIILTFEGVPIDELRLKKVGNTFVIPELGLELKYPPFKESDPFLDHPNQHIRTQKGDFYPRNLIYNAGSNVESNLTDGHKECRIKDLSDNASLSAVRIDTKLTEELITKKAISKKLNKYPSHFITPRYAQFESWREDRKMNLILETTFPATNVNRGRAEKSFNSELTIGNSFWPK
jgi:hypothetical protein